MALEQGTERRPARNHKGLTGERLMVCRHTAADSSLTLLIPLVLLAAVAVYALAMDSLKIGLFHRLHLHEL